MEEDSQLPEPQSNRENKHDITINKLFKWINDKLKIADDHINQIKERPSLIIRDATVATGAMLVAHGLWTLVTDNNNMFDALTSNDVSNFLPVEVIPNQVYSIAEVGTGIRMMDRAGSDRRPQAMSNSEMVFRLVKHNLASFLSNVRSNIKK